MSLELCRVVLVETHYPGNLGAAARVMHNFGLTDLVLVSPHASRDDPNARQMSTQGESILQNARIVATLTDAIHDCVLVVGTSGHRGGLFRRQSVGTPDEVMPHVVEALGTRQPVALVFGPEPTGLSNELVMQCQYVIQIPTGEEYPSLNLAQAVAICVYELHNTWRKSAVPQTMEPQASFELKEHMFRQLQTALEEIHFLYGDKAEPLMHALRHLLGKARLTEMETKVLLGLARQIRWYVEHHPRRE